MVEFTKKLYKDIGLQREVEDALPYAVVGGAWEGSFENQPMHHDAVNNVDFYYTPLSHIVPAGQQLKVLFLRVWTQANDGARYSVYQTNPVALGAPGAVEAYPVVGNVPQGARDYPMLEAAGAEILTGSLIDPVHVLEGSIEFRVLALWPGSDAAIAHTGARYGIVWWGVEKIPEPKR